jgi:hypothetical protein
MDEVYMDVPVVRDFASQFSNIGNILKGVSKTLEMLSDTLKVAAFMGLVGAAVAVQFIDTFKPPIEEMAEKCLEIGKDLIASADAYQAGDMTGANLFATKYGKA